MKDFVSQSTGTLIETTKTTAPSCNFHRRRALKMLLTPMIALLLSSNGNVFGMSVAGWKVSSAETRFSYRVPDGRMFTIGVCDAINPSKRVHGAVISVYRDTAGGRPPVRSAIPALQLREFQASYYSGTRSFISDIGDLFGNAKDLLSDWLKRGKKIWARVKDVVAAGEKLLEAVCNLLSELGLDICDSLIKDAGPAAAKNYLQSARAAAMAPNLLLSQRVAMALQQTIALQTNEANRRKVMLSLATTILDSAS